MLGIILKESGVCCQMICRTNLNSIQETGRLGNQMWAIASAIGIAERNNTDFFFPEWVYQPWFKNKLPNSLDLDYYMEGNKLKEYKEETPYYSDIKLSPDYIWNLKGYFQSYKYFEGYGRFIKYYFTPNFEVNDYSEDFVGVHVRRGDYLGLSNVHPVLTKEYYELAMSMFPKDEFMIFSDDIDWCMGSGWFDHKRCTFKEYEIRKDIELPAPQDLVHLIYMSQCKSYIIANSSFSWWAAYLGYSPLKTVVAPRVWVLNEDRDDRVPPDWIRL